VAVTPAATAAAAADPAGVGAGGIDAKAGDGIEGLTPNAQRLCRAITRQVVKLLQNQPQFTAPSGLDALLTQRNLYVARLRVALLAERYMLCRRALVEEALQFLHAEFLRCAAIGGAASVLPMGLVPTFSTPNTVRYLVKHHAEMPALLEALPLTDAGASLLRAMLACNFGFELMQKLQSRHHITPCAAADLLDRATAQPPSAAKAALTDDEHAFIATAAVIFELAASPTSDAATEL
jgi:hypothetical protein